MWWIPAREKRCLATLHDALLPKKSASAGRKIVTVEIQRVKLTDGISILERFRYPDLPKVELRRALLLFLLVGSAAIVLTSLKCIAPGQRKEFHSAKPPHGSGKMRSRALLQKLTRQQ